MPKDIGLLFDTEMITAFLEHRKSMTRRTRGLDKINEHPDEWILKDILPDGRYWFQHPQCTRDNYLYNVYIKCPYAVGDTIYAKETHAIAKCFDHLKINQLSGREHLPIWYKDSPEFYGLERGRWRSAMFIPKWASRIRRPLTAVGAGRVRSITPEDVKREGFNSREDFLSTIDRLHKGKDMVTLNFWVWKLTIPEVRRSGGKET